MSSCLENIIGIRAQCDGADTASLSGYFITDYPGVTINAAAQYNDEKTVTGYNYLVDLRRRAMLRLQNDIVSYINSNYRVNTIDGNRWATGIYNVPYSQVSIPGTEVQRGIVVSKQRTNCRFTKMMLSRVRIFSDFTGNATLTISDVRGAESVVYSPTIALEAGIIQEFDLHLLIEGAEVQITLSSEIPVYSNKPNCGVGCNGTLRNDCVRVYGLSDGATNTTEGYGIEADVLCTCDLSKIACDLATNGLIGQAAYELCGAMFYDEMIKNHRLNYLTIYKDEEIKQQSAAGFATYAGYLENAFKGLRNYLVANDGGCKCVDCSGVQIKSNV